MGAFYEGYNWPVFYTQDPSTNIWVGGPNISLAGVSFSSGGGTNGNISPEAIYYGGQTASGDYVSIYDDGGLEQSPDQWTIKTHQTGEISEAIIQVCSMDYDKHALTIGGNSYLTVPSYCINNMCGIMLWTDTTMGVFGPGFHWPVYYQQNLSNNWIAGPDINLGGVGFSTGSGTNGDLSPIYLIIGGTTPAGDYIRLYDDSQYAEFDNDKWSIVFNPGTELTEAAYYTFPMTCSSTNISTSGESSMSVPSYCIDSLCSILNWNDATMGAFGPGLNWPVEYKQNASNSSWKAGPAVSIGGITYSEGTGVNGDSTIDGVYIGGMTTSGEYVSLYDEGLVENSASFWTVDYNPGTELTSAAYFTCSNNCQETRVSLPRQFLPLTLAE
jgi:hypothetical protein